MTDKERDQADRFVCRQTEIQTDKKSIKRADRRTRRQTERLVATEPGRLINRRADREDIQRDRQSRVDRERWAYRRRAD